MWPFKTQRLITSHIKKITNRIIFGTDECLNRYQIPVVSKVNVNRYGKKTQKT